MPTTTEVEARLRRTAAACEPLVEDLLGEPPTTVVVPLGGRRRRPARIGLVAAAVLLVVALAGVALAVGRDEPAADVSAEGGTPSTTAAPAASGERLVLTLADGTRLGVGLPDLDRWSPAGAQLQVAIDGVAPPVLVDLEQASLEEIGSRLGGAPQVEERGPGVTLLVGGQVSVLVVEQDGWSAVVTVAAAGRPEADLPAAAVDALAEGLDFAVTDGGPVDLTGPGLTVLDVSQLVERTTPDGETATIVITRNDVGSPPACDLDAETERCIAGFEVGAIGAAAEAALPDVTLVVLDDSAPAVGELDVALPYGTTLPLDVPGEWVVVGAGASVQVNGLPEDGTAEVTFVPRSLADHLAAEGLALAEERGPDRGVVSTTPQSRVVASIDGWTADVVYADPEPIDVLRFAADEIRFRVTDGGPTDMSGPGLAPEVTESVVLAPVGGASDDRLEIHRERGRTIAACAGDLVDARCLADDTLLVEATGPDAVAALDGLALAGEPDAPGEPGTEVSSTLTLSLLDGTAVELGLFEDRDWGGAPSTASARLAIDGVEGEHTVEVGPGTIDEWVAGARTPATTAPTATAGAVLATVGDDVTLLAGRHGVLLATVPVRRDGVDRLPPDVVEALAAALVVPADGAPTPIAGPGITVVSATAELVAGAPEPDVVLTATVGADAEAICAEPEDGVRCVDGVALEPATEADRELVEQTEVTVTWSA